MKRGQSKAQQQYIQGFFKKKPCQRQVDAVQSRSEQGRVQDFILGVAKGGQEQNEG